MGCCKDCIYYEKDDCHVTGYFFDRHYCKLFTYLDKEKDKYVFHYVKPNDSCDKFSEYIKNTPENSNFKSGNSGGCFLTSACVDYLGKADTCEELTVLRAFRDGYMKNVYGGDELIKEYYAIAPKIVENINASDKKDKYYAYINETINKCVKLISINENERALTEYKFMVENLKKEFSI